MLQVDLQLYQAWSFVRLRVARKNCFCQCQNEGLVTDTLLLGSWRSCISKFTHTLCDKLNSETTTTISCQFVLKDQKNPCFIILHLYVETRYPIFYFSFFDLSNVNGQGLLLLVRLSSILTIYNHECLCQNCHFLCYVLCRFIHLKTVLFELFGEIQDFLSPFSKLATCQSQQQIG